MSRRSASVESDNLELLLDTMCNSFGGVMFIAILLAVLTQFAQVKTSPAAQEEAAKMKQLQMEALQQEVGRLRVAREGQDRLIKELMGGEDPNRLLTKLADLRTENEKLQRELHALVDAERKAQEQMSASSREKAQLEAKIRDLEKVLADLEAKLKERVKPEQRTMVVRTVRPSQKDTFGFIVKWNRLFLLQLPTREQPGPPNQEAVRFKEYRVGQVPIQEFEALPGRGIPLDNPNWSSSSEVQQVLQNLASERYSMQFVVYSDSFRTFIQVRDFFRSKGYEWNWHIVAREDAAIKTKPGVPKVQ